MWVFISYIIQTFQPQWFRGKQIWGMYVCMYACMNLYACMYLCRWPTHESWIICKMLVTKLSWAGPITYMHAYIHLIHWYVYECMHKDTQIGWLVLYTGTLEWKANLTVTSCWGAHVVSYLVVYEYIFTYAWILSHACMYMYMVVYVFLVSCDCVGKQMKN